MKMTQIKPNFKDENEGNIVRLTALLTIFFSFIPGLVIYYAMPDSLSKESKEIIAEMVNFNIVGFLAILLCSVIPTIGLVPIIGWLASAVVYPLVLIINIVIALQILNNSEVKIPVIFQIFKAEN